MMFRKQWLIHSTPKSSQILSLSHRFIWHLEHQKLLKNCLLLKIYHFRNLEISGYLKHKTLLRAPWFKWTFAPNILKLNTNQSIKTKKIFFPHFFSDLFCKKWEKTLIAYQHIYHGFERHFPLMIFQYNFGI